MKNLERVGVNDILYITKNSSELYPFSVLFDNSYVTFLQIENCV